MSKAIAKERINDIALARFERWALPRMARRLPGWVTPDVLTVLGVIAAAIIGAAYFLTGSSLDWLWVANIGFVVHWWADSLDGTLARVRDIRRERYGFYVDHQCDAVSSLFIFAGLGFSPLMDLSAALFLLVAYYLMMLLVSFVTIARNVFKISFGGVGPTEGRLAMIVANTLIWAFDGPTFEVAGRTMTAFTLLGIVGTGVLLLYYTYFSLVERATLAKLDPPPKPGHGAEPPPAQQVIKDETVLEHDAAGSR